MFDNVLSERAKTFDALVNEQKDTSAAVTADAKDKLAKLLDASREHHEADRNEMKHDADQILAGPRELRSEAKHLLGVIGTIGVTSGYLKVADAAGSSKRKWQVTTVIEMLGLIAVAWLAFLPLLAGTVQWESSAGRVFVSLTVGVLAAYAAHHADRHQTVEQRNRRLELELASVGPFLEPLPVEKQEEFKFLMAERIFGRADGEAIADGSSPATVLDLLQKKEVRDTLELMSAFSKTAAKVSGVQAVTNAG